MHLADIQRSKGLNSIQTVFRVVALWLNDNPDSYICYIFHRADAIYRIFGIPKQLDESRFDESIELLKL